jgi:hypothetical protein
LQDRGEGEVNRESVPPFKKAARRHPLKGRTFSLFRSPPTRRADRLASSFCGNDELAYTLWRRGFEALPFKGCK